MKLRKAIDITRDLYEGDRARGSIRRWKPATIWKAREIARRKGIHDRRVPFIPTDEELQERAEFAFCLFAQALGLDADELHERFADNHRKLVQQE